MDEEYQELLRDYIAYALWMRPLIHQMHFDTQSYSQHMALNEYYDGIDDLIDEIAECSMGAYNIDLLENISGRSMKFTYQRSSNAVSLIKEFNNYCSRVRQAAKEKDEGWLQNLIEGVQGFNHRIIYKLIKLH